MENLYNNLLNNIINYLVTQNNNFVEHNLHNTRYEKEEYELAEIIFFELRDDWKNKNKEKIIFPITETTDIDRTRTISISIKNILLDFYHNPESRNKLEMVPEERFPSLDALLEKIYTFKCECLQQYDFQRNELEIILQYYCMFYGKYPNCTEIPYLLEFYIIQKRIPTQDELEEHIYRSIRFNLNPEEYHQSDKEFIPTIGIDKLPIEKYINAKNNLRCISCQESCSICQEDLSDEQDVIKLVPCGHLYHSTNSECLENAGIRNWLELYNHCPLCKQKITPHDDGCL